MALTDILITMNIDTHLPVLVSPQILEAAIRAAGVGDAGLVANVPIPLPGAALRTLGRRVGAVDS